MHTSGKISFLVSVLAIAFAFITLPIPAQSKSKNTKKKHPTTIGFQTGRDLRFNTDPSFSNKQGRLHCGINNQVVVKKQLKPHFKVETGINVGLPGQNTTTTTNSKFRYLPNLSNASIPATLQYCFLPEKCKVHPYFGAGLQYNLNINGNINSPFSGDVTPATSDAQTGTRYISILFTQGVTFEVNTKIQITQSFHFIPNNNNRTFGLDLGIGYTIP